FSSLIPRCSRVLPSRPFPYTTLFRSGYRVVAFGALVQTDVHCFDFVEEVGSPFHEQIRQAWGRTGVDQCRAILLLEFLCITELLDRKSTRLNSSHLGISYAVFCLKK